MSYQKKKGNKRLEGALYFLLFTWSILLVLLIFIFLLKLNGYSTFQEWRDSFRNTEEPSPLPTMPPEGQLVSTITPTAEPLPSQYPEPTPLPTSEAVPTVRPTPTPVQEPELSGEEILQEIEKRYGATIKEYGQTDTEYDRDGIRTTLLAFPSTGEKQLDEAIREDIAEALEKAGERLKESEQDPETRATVLALNYDCYRNENFLSVVFCITEDVAEENKEAKTVTELPLVYRMDTGERVEGQEMFYETYFAVLKERLMTEIGNHMEPEEGVEEPFLSYATPYCAEDYSLYYFTGDKVVFYFPENTLTKQMEHEAFEYEADLKEALAFMKYTLSGKSTKREIRELDPNGKMVAFTFDDGAHAPVEKRLLKAFETYNGRATFFTLGERTAGSYGDMLRDLYDAGHEIASHTYSHQYLNKKSEETFWQEINKANLQIAKTVGHAPEYVRLPGGNYPEWYDTAPMPLIDWSLDSRDWKSRDADAVYEKVMSEINDGDIILMHSLYQSTADAIERLLPELQKKGYQFVTVSELFYYKGITPENGVKYKSGE
ncbi:MAG: polysaccharide deacetylase family protein [Lachnospiraceae bacterium]